MTRETMFLYHLLNKNVYLCKVKRTFIKNGINHSYSGMYSIRLQGDA